MTISIANAAGFLGDNKWAPRQLVEQAEIDVLTLEYLAELTLSILARQRRKDPHAGYALDLVDVVKDLSPSLISQPTLKIVSNGGGVNPSQCVRHMAQELCGAGLADLSLGMVAGDDITDRLGQFMADGLELKNLDTDVPLRELRQPIVSANVYLGSAPLVSALQQDARIVVTGRVADAALTIAPALYHYGWDWDDWNRLAGAAVAGHVIECGAQATGGYSVEWSRYDLRHIGYPIAEIDDDGSSLISKPEPSGGDVRRQTVIEQLVYEIGDPRHYLTPDVDVDFTSLKVEQAAPNLVAISNAKGNPAPDSLKVSIAYEDGFRATSLLLVYGDDCIAKAQEAAEIVFSRLAQEGYRPQRHLVELLGANQSIPGVPPIEAPEVVLRISVHDANKELVEAFTQQIAPLITSGPAGLAGYAGGRARVQPVYAYWPALIPRSRLEEIVQVHTALEWTNKPLGNSP